MPEPKSPFKRVRRAFERDTLKRVCEMHETDFAAAYGMDVTATPMGKWWDADYPAFYAHLDRGSNILAVAHLDTVVNHATRTANFIDTAAGPIVYSGALDDRLGAYTILELLPKLGVNVDVLLTTGEESGESTAQHFAATKDYHWMIEFDRGGTDVVMYDYEDDECVDLVESVDARVGMGSYSDIAFLEHLEIKGFNWGVGYQDYHGPRSHAYLEDYWLMMGRYLNFHDDNAGIYLPHERQTSRFGHRSSLRSLWDEEVECFGCQVPTSIDDLNDDFICKICTGDEDPYAEEKAVLDTELVSEDFGVVNREIERAWM